MINHTDLYFKTLIKLKEKIKTIGTIKSVILTYGKKDPYFFKNIKVSSDLPFYEWLHHPLAIINDFFKDFKFTKIIKDKQKRKGNLIIQNLKVIFYGKKFNIKIFFSNNYKHKKRNLIIDGSKGLLVFKGYNNYKGYLLKKNRKINLTAKSENPIQNLLDNFKTMQSKSKR